MPFSGVCELYYQIIASGRAHKTNSLGDLLYVRNKRRGCLSRVVGDVSQCDVFGNTGFLKKTSPTLFTNLIIHRFWLSLVSSLRTCGLYTWSEFLNITKSRDTFWENHPRKPNAIYLRKRRIIQCNSQCNLLGFNMWKIQPQYIANRCDSPLVPFPRLWKTSLSISRAKLAKTAGRRMRLFGKNQKKQRADVMHLRDKNRHPIQSRNSRAPTFKNRDSLSKVNRFLVFMRGRASSRASDNFHFLLELYQCY